MIINVGLPKSFWGEAVAIACYLINRCPSQSIGLKTPMEMWTGQLVDYSHLKVFGCLAYAYYKQDKLDPRALKCIFIGYPERVKGYKLWCLEEGRKKCFVSGDVIFNEMQMAKLVDWKTANEGSLLKEKFQLEVEFQKKGSCK